MGYFASDAEVHEVLGGTFQQLVTDPATSEKLTKTDTVFTLQLERPRATITVKLLPGQEPQVDLGTATIRPECAFQMDTDVAHAFFLGRLNPTGALSKGTIKTRGPVAKVLKVFPIVPTIAEAYAARISAAGREDLLAEEPPEVPAGLAIEEARKAEAAAAEEAPTADAEVRAAEDAPAESPAGEEAPIAAAEAAPATDDAAPAQLAATEDVAADPADTRLEAPSDAPTGEDAPPEPAAPEPEATPDVPGEEPEADAAEAEAPAAEVPTEVAEEPTDPASAGEPPAAS